MGLGTERGPAGGGPSPSGRAAAATAIRGDAIARGLTPGYPSGQACPTRPQPEGRKMAHIDYYFATVSPFTYLAGTRLDAIADRHGASVAYKPLDIIGLFGRTGGVPPKDRHPARQAYRLQELRRQAKKAGLAMNLKPAHWPTNPAPSSYALIAASKTDAGADPSRMGALVHGITRACWAEERDIADDAVIRDVLAAEGFDPALADSGMLAGAEQYGRNLEEAVSRDVFGAPFYLVGEERFWGQDRLDDLDLHLAGKL